MVEHCRRAYPEGAFEVADLREVGRWGEGSFDAVVGPYNVIDVLDDAERGELLDALHAVLAPGGLLVVSSHNRAAEIRPPTHVRTGDPLRLLADVARIPRRLRNRRRLRRFEERHDGYAILNDNAHDYTTLHYYVTRDAGARQLAEHGFELLEVLDLDGRPVAEGQAAAHSSELHYVARRAG